MTIKIFNYPIAKRLILLIVGDLLIVNGSIFLSAIIRLGLSGGCEYLRSNSASFALTALAFLFTFFFFELYDIRKDFKSIGNILTIAFASGSAFIITTFFILYKLVFADRTRGIYYQWCINYPFYHRLEAFIQLYAGSTHF